MIGSCDERVVARRLSVLQAPADADLNSRRTLRFWRAEDKTHYWELHGIELCEATEYGRTGLGISRSFSNFSEFMDIL